MATPRPKITSVEAHILVSPNAPDIFELPVGMSKNDTPSEPRPSDATTFRWSLNPFPQLPYCLKYPRYQGPFYNASLIHLIRFPLNGTTVGASHRVWQSRGNRWRHA